MAPSCSIVTRRREPRRLNICCRNSVNPPWHGSNSAVALSSHVPSFLVSIERQELMRTFVKRSVVKLSLVAAVGACALGAVGLHAASAADMPMPQAEMQPPPPDYYGPPPAGYAYPPPPAAYGPPPVGYAYPRPLTSRPLRYRDDVMSGLIGVATARVTGIATRAGTIGADLRVAAKQTSAVG